MLLLMDLHLFGLVYRFSDFDPIEKVFVFTFDFDLGLLLAETGMSELEELISEDIWAEFCCFTDYVIPPGLTLFVDLF